MKNHKLRPKNTQLFPIVLATHQNLWKKITVVIELHERNSFHRQIVETLIANLRFSGENNCGFSRIQKCQWISWRVALIEIPTKYEPFAIILRNSCDLEIEMHRETVFALIHLWAKF